MDKPYHCIILSTKSAGSSALQKFLVQDYGFSMIDKTSHHENETLYWTKAASVLGIPQLKMHRSHVPYSKNEALKALQQFCKDNKMGLFDHENSTKECVFDCYYSLIKQHSPRFVEKSPHHLYNESNLDLIAEFIARYKDEIDFKVIGLVRHPLSVIYSSWERWKYDSSGFEKEWQISNSNLLKYQEKLGIEIIKYEDLVEEQGACMANIMNLDPQKKSFEFKSTSLSKWKQDEEFGHRLNDKTIRIAEKFGYSDFIASCEDFSWKVKSFSTYVGIEMRRLFWL